MLHNGKFQACPESPFYANSPCLQDTRSLVRHMYATRVNLFDADSLFFRTAPIQIIVCAILLILQIGPSALVGLALFAALIPLQSKVSDKRAYDKVTRVGGTLPAVCKLANGRAANNSRCQHGPFIGR